MRLNDSCMVPQVKALRDELERSGLSGAGTFPGASQQTQEVTLHLYKNIKIVTIID